MRTAWLLMLLGGWAWAADWPQLGNGPQRTGYSAESLKPPFKLKWNVQFQPERLYPAMQPVVAGGRICLGTESGNLHFLSAADGKRLWKTEPLKGALAFKDYWPVVHRGMVIVRPFGPWEAAAFDEETGQPVELTIPGGNTMNGSVAPPCVDGEGWLVTAKGGGWCRVDLASKAIEDISTKEGGRGNHDENMIASAAGRITFVMHCQEGNAQFTGCYDIASKAWHRIGGGPWQNLVSNTQGGGASQAIVADGHL